MPSRRYVDRVAIVGSRHWADREAARRAVRKFVGALAAKYPRTIVVSGGAATVDITAEDEALRQGCKVLSFRPIETPDRRFMVVLLIRYPGGRELTRLLPDEYPDFGNAAFARNTWIVKGSYRIAAFHNGDSRGTRNALQEARRLGRAAYLIPVYAIAQLT